MNTGNNKAKMVKGPQIEDKDLHEAMKFVPSSHQHKAMPVAMKELHEGKLSMQDVGGKGNRAYESKGVKPSRLKEAGNRMVKGLGRSVAKMAVTKMKAKMK